MSATSGKPLRNRRGEFATPLSDLELYGIVREVAELAVELGDDPLKNPAKISQDHWGFASRFHASELGRPIPQAREICRRLHDHAGRPYPWQELLAKVFEETSTSPSTTPPADRYPTARSATATSTGR